MQKDLQEGLIREKEEYLKMFKEKVHYEKKL